MTDNSLKKTGENFNEKSTHENKQIIIDGVDVRGCEQFIEDYQFANNIEGRYEHRKNICECGIQGVGHFSIFCKENYCYFKLLARKTQECEDLKSHIKEWSDYVNKVRSWITEAAENLELDPAHSFGPEHFTFAVRCLKEKYTKISDENVRYKQALEKIEEIAKNLRTRTDYHSENEVNADIDMILTTIDEVKNAR